LYLAAVLSGEGLESYEEGFLMRFLTVLFTASAIDSIF
jgi:hypothetical protein